MSSDIRYVHSTDIVAYTYWADIYCAGCAENLPVFDPEGNPARPVFADYEFDFPVDCGSCYGQLDVTVIGS